MSSSFVATILILSVIGSPNRGGVMKGPMLVALACALAFAIWPADKKKKKEEQTQTLQLPKELPGAIMGETRRLNFYVTPLSAKGLLSAQIRDALKALLKEAAGSQILKIRAFT